jgi:hypothetical protein
MHVEDDILVSGQRGFPSTNINQFCGENAAIPVINRSDELAMT